MPINSTIAHLGDGMNLEIKFQKNGTQSAQKFRCATPQQLPTKEAVWIDIRET